MDKTLPTLKLFPAIELLADSRTFDMGRIIQQCTDHKVASLRLARDLVYESDGSFNMLKFIKVLKYVYENKEHLIFATGEGTIVINNIVNYTFIFTEETMFLGIAILAHISETGQRCVIYHAAGSKNWTIYIEANLNENFCN